MYQNGKIYKIWDSGFNECYIGSTCEELSRRMSGHRHKYQRYLKGLKDNTSSFYLFDKYGVENCKIELLELYPCNSKAELTAREGHHQRNNDCVNIQIAGRNKKQYYEECKETINEKKKIYAEEHKEETREYKKQYYQENKLYVSSKCKKYYEENKDKLLEYVKEYYKNNKEKVQARRQQTIKCECGLEMRKYSLKQHLKSLKHQQYINQMN